MGALRGLVRALGLQVLGGLAVWGIVAAAAIAVDDARLDLVTVLLLFGQLVVVPLGLLFVADPVVSAARVLFRLGGVAALASLAIPRGELSAAVAALYLLPALLVGAASAVRFVAALRDGSALRAPNVAAAAAGVFLAVGATFFVLHRQDAAFAGFPELIVQLMAVHFHFAGFGLMLMAGALARHSPGIGTVAVWLLLAGMLLTPIGLLTNPILQVTGALAVVAALAAIAAGTLPVLADPAVRPSARRTLFISIACSLVVGVMAALYAVGEATGEPPILLAVMAGVHGTFAAIGVVFGGLVGWRLAADRSR
jgi:hypothetical protein